MLLSSRSVLTIFRSLNRLLSNREKLSLPSLPRRRLIDVRNKSTSKILGTIFRSRRWKKGLEHRREKPLPKKLECGKSSKLLKIINFN